MLSHFSCVRFFPTLRSVARQAPLSMGFSRQEYWSGLTFPPPGDLPSPGIEPVSPALAGRFFITEPPGKPNKQTTVLLKYLYTFYWATQAALVVKKNLPANAGNVRDPGSIPGLGRPPGGGHGNPLQFSCLENPMDRGAWWAKVSGVAKSQI